MLLVLTIGWLLRVEDPLASLPAAAAKVLKIGLKKAEKRGKLL